MPVTRSRTRSPRRTRTVVLFAYDGCQSLDVTGGLEGMVDRHLTEIAQKLWTARSARIAQIMLTTHGLDVFVAAMPKKARPVE